MRTILVVEDEPNIAALVRDYLVQGGFEAVLAHDGETGLREARVRKPDLVILDLGLPKRDGIDVIRELRKTSEVPVVILTARGEETDRILGLELGTDDYVVKPFSPREVTARVQAILRRTRPKPAAVETGQALQHGRLTLDTEGWTAAWDGADTGLTVTELQILKALLSAPSRVFSRDAIIDRLHGPGFAITDRTVDSHVRNLRGKFARLGGHDVVETRAGVGYRLGACRGDQPG